jgi:hypothetical protein
MIELLDIVASGLVPAEYAAPLDERMRSLAALSERSRAAMARCWSRCGVTRRPPTPTGTQATGST